MWGPAPIRLGFIGAPIATAISLNLITIISIIYGAYFVPLTAWQPWSFRCFTNLGILVSLGLAGIGMWIVFSQHVWLAYREMTRSV